MRTLSVHNEDIDVLKNESTFISIYWTIKLKNEKTVISIDKFFCFILVKAK